MSDRVLLTNHIELYARLTDVELYQNILEPFCTKMHSDAMRLTDQLGYSICLLYGQGFHTYSRSNLAHSSDRCSSVIELHLSEI